MVANFWFKRWSRSLRNLISGLYERVFETVFDWVTKRLLLIWSLQGGLYSPGRSLPKWSRPCLVPRPHYSARLNDARRLFLTVFITPCFINVCFINVCFINPCFITPRFINPCFITPCFINPCFINPVQTNPVQCFITWRFLQIFHTRRWDKYRKRTVPCTQFSLICAALIKTFSVSRIVCLLNHKKRFNSKLNFSLFLFHFFRSIQFICRKGSLRN